MAIAIVVRQHQVLTTNLVKKTNQWTMHGRGRTPRSQVLEYLDSKNLAKQQNGVNF